MAYDQTQTTDSAYETLDIYLAAYHSLCGAKVALRKETKTVFFLIARGPEFHDVQKQYETNSPVPITDYVNEVKMMRTKMNTKKFGDDRGGK